MKDQLSFLPSLYNYLYIKRLDVYPEKEISSNQIDSIFERFVKLDTFTPRAGLGLSIVKRIVELLEGNIWVESDISKGASFFFATPIKQKAGNHPRYQLLMSN